MMLEEKYGKLEDPTAVLPPGLNQAGEMHGFEGDGFIYLRNPMWWAGICTLVIGEICNFAAYAFAPAILVTPLGALSVLIGAVLGSYFLGEELGKLGRLGSAICLIGAVIIVLHAPPDEDIETIETILSYALRPGFLIYAISVTGFSVFMIYKISPIYGKRNPLVYLSICSLVGSVSVMAIKAFGIALKLTFAGNNQFSHASTYVFMIITGVCILTQMNYFNKALSQFPTNIVNPLYYVTFTSATLCASFILFSGFNTTDPINTLSLICGFLVTFTGVYLLNLSRGDPNGFKMVSGRGGDDAVGTDIISQIQTRRSMEARRSLGSHRVSADREGLMRAYDEEEAAEFGLTDLADDSDEERNGRRTRQNGAAPVNGRPKSTDLGAPKSGGR
ncbi:putative magnesium transporter NIPA4 [Cytospora mali]|uniref:Magnesium transporter NIPA4 n=1 Tax=Cytospora mali TaxID=578113 RepID=A0A194VEI9_CYTMA|nr:putative magnesium transporter NIPA4 [Valsa mali var. pyri (nom. inval.)]